MEHSGTYRYRSNRRVYRCIYYRFNGLTCHEIARRFFGCWIDEWCLLSSQTFTALVSSRNRGYSWFTRMESCTYRPCTYEINRPQEIADRHRRTNLRRKEHE